MEQLQDAVRRLAAPAADQIAYLDELGVGPLADELALEFSDILQAVVGDDRLAAPRREALLKLDELLDRMSGVHDTNFWTRDALERAEEWAEVRDAARKVLESG